MSASRRYKRQVRNISVKTSPYVNKKIRKPLECKKNIIQTNESRKNSLIKRKSEEKYTNSETNKKSFLRSPKKPLHSSSPRQCSLSRAEKFDFIEIDTLSNFRKSNRKTSISRQSRENQHAEILFVKENTTRNLNSLKHKENLEKLSDISPFIQTRTLRKSVRQSNNHSENPKSKRSLDDMDSILATPKTSELPIDSLSLQNRFISRSSQKHKRTSNDKVFSYGSETKKIEKSTRKQKNALLLKNKKRKTASRHTAEPETDIIYKTPQASKLFMDTGSSRSSVILRARQSSGKTVQEKEINSVSRSTMNNKTPETVERFRSSSRSSTRLRTSSSSDKPSRKRISLRVRHHSEKASKDLLSNEIPHVAKSGQIKKHPLASEEQTKRNVENVKNKNRRASSAKQETDVLVNKHKRSYSSSKHNLKSKTDECFNDKGLQTPKQILSKSAESITSPLRKSPRLLPEKNSKKSPRYSRVRKCVVVLSDVNKKRQSRKSAVSLKEQNYSTGCSPKSKKDKYLNELQTPRKIPSNSPKVITSSPRKTPSNSPKVITSSPRKTPSNSPKVITSSPRRSSRLSSSVSKSEVSSNKQKTEEKGKKSPKRRLLSSPLKTISPIQKRRRLSVHFKKQARPRSFSAVIPIDDLALTPANVRKTKSDGFKFPGKNTLKRKRFVMEEIKKADVDYEDDIYESQSFDHFKDMFPDSSDSSVMSCPMKTPKLASLLTPGIHIKTPVYRDCFSPTEYAINRKIAEEYMYRNKRKKRTSEVETPVVPEKKRLEFNNAVEKACAVQREVERLTAESSDDEDYYFNEDT